MCHIDLSFVPYNNFGKGKAGTTVQAQRDRQFARGHRLRLRQTGDHLEGYQLGEGTGTMGERFRWGQWEKGSGIKKYKLAGTE